LAAEDWTFEELAAAGWSEGDLAWEERSEVGMAKLADGHQDGAQAAFANAVTVAIASFSADDPRFATCLANHGAALIAAGRAELSGRSIADAARIWRDCDGWIANMTAPRVARSSLFHMRMEQRHRATYEARWRVKWDELAAEARGLVIGDGPLQLISADQAEERLKRWRREKPAMLNHTRKLMAAVILLACRRS
jgi:hypothetical protein